MSIRLGDDTLASISDGLCDHFKHERKGKLPTVNIPA